MSRKKPVPRPRSRTGTGTGPRAGGAEASLWAGFVTHYVTFPHGGETVLAEILFPPDDAPEDVIEGFLRRATVTVVGECPCGAVRLLPTRAERRLAKHKGQSGIPILGVEHEADCPAGNDVLMRKMREWRAEK